MLKDGSEKLRSWTSAILKRKRKSYSGERKMLLVRMVLEWQISF